jgi:hypothetical protein
VPELVVDHALGAPDGVRTSVRGGSAQH